MSALLRQFLAQRPLADPKWVEKAAEAGKAELANLPPAIQPIADAMFDKLLDHEDEIISFGPQVFSLMLTHLAAGSIDQAKLIYLATIASQDERDDALDKATDAAMKDQQATDAAWEKAKGIAEDILLTGAKVAVPLLLTAIMAL